MKQERLAGVIDMHIHSAPDVRQRKMNDLEIMEAAITVGIRAVVIKSHHVPTADRAALVNAVKAEKYGSEQEFTMFGGIALNRFVGGINPWAVETALKLGGKVVWMPTNTAENHCRKEGGENPVICVSGNQVVQPLHDIFELIKEYDAVLATGHISPTECLIVTEAARTAGVEKIVITHPEFHIVGMTIEEQLRLARDYDVMFERVYAQPLGGGIYKKNLADNVEAIRMLGTANTIVSTDGGQMQNPKWNLTIAEYVDYLHDSGFTQKEIDQMTKINPAAMLGIYE